MLSHQWFQPHCSLPLRESTPIILPVYHQQQPRCLWSEYRTSPPALTTHWLPNLYFVYGQSTTRASHGGASLLPSCLLRVTSHHQSGSLLLSSGILGYRYQCGHMSEYMPARDRGGVRNGLAASPVTKSISTTGVPMVQNPSITENPHLHTYITSAKAVYWSE